MFFCSQDHCSLEVQGRRPSEVSFSTVHALPDSELLNDGSVSTAGAGDRWRHQEVRLPRGLAAGGEVRLRGRYHIDRGALGLDNLHLGTDRRCIAKR